MPELRLTIEGKPLPQLRPRIFTRGSITRAYDPCANDKQKVRKQISQQLLFHQPLDCPLIIDIKFYMPIPASTSKKNFIAMLSGEIQHTSRPDLDNCYKFSTDAMNGLVYTDDSRIWKMSAEKLYSDRPRTDIIIKY